MPAHAARPEAAPRLQSHHRRHVALVIVATQVCLALLTAAGVYAGYGRLNDNIGQGQRIEHHVDAPGGDHKPLNILVMGEDTRAGEGNQIDGSTAPVEGEGTSRSDTTILLHARADRDKVYGVSLPRDAMVARPDCMVDGETVEGEDPVMFNSAFTVGGPQCTVQTVESLTGVYIDHFVVLDFNGFKQMVDAVGGVEVCIPEDVDDDEHKIHFEAGTQELEGQQALDYVRERYVLSVTGDIGRMRRQQAFLASMINKVMSAGTLSRPDRVYGFLNAVTESITVDEDIDSVATLFDMVTQFRSTDPNDIRFVTVPIAAYEPDPNRLVWTEDAEKLWRRIRTDQPLGKKFSEDSVRADDEIGTASDDPEATDTGATDETATDETTPDDALEESPDEDTSEPGSPATSDGSDISEEEAAERRAHGLCA